MNSLKIASSKVTPEINFDIDNSTLTFLKVSKPENAHEFYRPLFEFIERFEDKKVKSKEIRQLSIDFKFEYFNTATAKIIYQLLDKFEKIKKYGVYININWFYEEDDEDMLEEGEMISEALGIPFNFKILDNKL